MLHLVNSTSFAQQQPVMELIEVIFCVQFLYFANYHAIFALVAIWPIGHAQLLQKPSALNLVFLALLLACTKSNWLSQ